MFGGQPLDFVILCSSLSSILGGLGFAAYAAANLYMDVHAHARTRSGATPWLSINWDGWRFDQDSDPAGGSHALAMTAAEGGEAFDRILGLNAGPQIAVSTGDLALRVERWIALRSVREAEQGAAAGRGLGVHARPALSTEYVAPRGDLEMALAGIWAELFGIGSVGVHDDFFELGGDSLLGVQMNARLRRALAIDLPLRTLFESPTIAQLANACEEVLVAELNELDDDQAAQLLERGA
jgi:phthiocerol/phenolphthiocerol synthesis type-I polyketide synthase E